MKYSTFGKRTALLLAYSTLSNAAEHIMDRDDLAFALLYDKSKEVVNELYTLITDLPEFQTLVGQALQLGGESAYVKRCLRDTIGGHYRAGRDRRMAGRLGAMATHTGRCSD